MKPPEADAGAYALDADFYHFTQDVQSAIFEALAAARSRVSEPYPAPPPILLLRGGYAESPGWFLVQANEFDPEPLDVANLRVRDIYASERIVQALLDVMASEEWLDRQAGSKYYLTEAGRAVSKRIADRRQQFMAEIRPQPKAEIAELEKRLAQVIAIALESQGSEPPWCLAHSRNRAPGVDALPLDHIRQYLEDLNAFRDDAHMAAWRPFCDEGYKWEAFSYLCDGQAATAEELFEALAYRGYARSDFGEALDYLKVKGYIDTEKNGPDAHYAVTELGQDTRREVEQATDNYFYGPWGHLTSRDRERMRTLLEHLRDSLRTFATTPKEEQTATY